jgi:hypothetical protein
VKILILFFLVGAEYPHRLSLLQPILVKILILFFLVGAEYPHRLSLLQPNISENIDFIFSCRRGISPQA